MHVLDRDFVVITELSNKDVVSLETKSLFKFLSVILLVKDESLYMQSLKKNLSLRTYCDILL